MMAVYMNLGEIRLLVLDCDGVLTPGDVVYNDDQGRIMSFNIQDGHAIKRWIGAGHRVAILSGRRSMIVDRRAAELGIAVVRQGIGDKAAGLSTLLEELSVSADECCYAGDDLPDVPAVQACGFGVAVGNAAPGLKRVADYVTRRRGGAGAVAEVIELLLRRQKRDNHARK